MAIFAKLMEGCTYHDLYTRVEDISQNVNALYVNIISLMSVFVAIFALITVNANIAFELTTENMADVFWGIIKINIFVILCILVLLWGTRKILIEPLLNNKKGKGEKSF